MTDIQSPVPLIGLSVAGFGAQPAAWRFTPGDPARVWRAGFTLDLVRRAEAAAIDFVLFPDDLRRDDSRGRLDPVLLAARVAPATSAIGLIAETAVTHREPFHISKAIATLDHVSRGRAGWSVTVDTSQTAAELAGLRSAPNSDAAWDEAREVIEVVRALWDSWEDDAVIRDLTTGRFIDRDKVHYVDFVAGRFSVKGPSITPRPPQGQPPVLVSSADPAAAAARESAEVVIGAAGDGVRLVELEVVVDIRASAARQRAAQLGSDQRGGDLGSDQNAFVGSARELADRIVDLVSGCDGVLLKPAVNALDVSVITDQVIPILIERDILSGHHRHTGLRARFGLPAATNRYAELTNRGHS